uniref:Uncharacterized protein n=1 Tax=Salmonella phage vB_SE130_2P TaxID=3236707 RepID=A0AB39C3N8_9VIRU
MTRFLRQVNPTGTITGASQPNHSAASMVRLISFIFW